MPPLLPENEDAEMIYLLVQNQRILEHLPMGGSVPYAINHEAIHMAIDRYEDMIDDPVDCFEKVVMLANHMIGDEREKAAERSRK